MFIRTIYVSRLWILWVQELHGKWKIPILLSIFSKKQMNAWMHVENRREPSTAQRKNYQHCQRLFLFKQESTIFTLRSPLFLLQTTSGATSKIIRKIYCLNDKQSIFTIPSPTLIFYRILQHLLGGSAKDDSLIKQTHHCCSKMKNKWLSGTKQYNRIMRNIKVMLFGLRKVWKRNQR